MAQNTDQLTSLRSQILDELVTHSDQLMLSQSVGYDALLAIAHLRADASLLPKVLEKIHDIEDEEYRANALLDLLNEVELQMSYADQPDETVEQPEATTIDDHDGSSVQYSADGETAQPEHDQHQG